MTPKDEEALGELANLRETNARLNRRCQQAEAALNMRIEDYELRSRRAIREYFFTRGREAGEERTAAAIAALTARLTEAQQEIVWLKERRIGDGAIVHKAQQQAEAADARYTALRARIERFIQKLRAQVTLSEYDVSALEATMNQQLASILAERAEVKSHCADELAALLSEPPGTQPTP